MKTSVSVPDTSISTPETAISAPDSAMSAMETTVSVPDTAIPENQESVVSTQTSVSATSETSDTLLKSEPAMCTQHVTVRTPSFTVHVYAHAEVPAAPVYHESEDTARSANNSSVFQNTGSGDSSTYNVIEIKPILNMEDENN